MGKIVTITCSIKPLTQSPRNIYIYLPTDYSTTTCHFPVLYMFDGHNLFSDNLATYGKSWGLKDYLDQHNIPLIVVGIDCNHIGDYRLREYCPYDVISKRIRIPEILGDITANWLVNTLKPLIESKYRVSANRNDIGIGGSSMGGLMSLYCITKYSHIFSKAACLSSSFDLCYKGIIEHTIPLKINPKTRIYMDYGTKETKSREATIKRIQQHLEIEHILQDKGCYTYLRLVEKGTHCEASWETCIPYFLEFLYSFK